jgi:uncharacterized delta-60 repeat protein
MGRGKAKAIALAASSLSLALTAVTASSGSAFATPGAYDPYFGSGGVVVNAGVLQANAVAVYSGNGDVVTASVLQTNNEFRVDRYSTTGIYVSAGQVFGSGTTATAVATVPAGIANAGNAVAAGFEPDVAGCPTAPTQDEPVIAEFNRAGTPVLNPQLVALPVCGRFTGVTVDSAGRIVATGVGYTAAGGTASGILVARFNSNGALDTTFNAGGTPGYYLVPASEASGSSSIANAISLVTAGPTSGDIAVAGSITAAGLGRLAVMEFTSAGIPDHRFGGLGIAGGQPGAQANGLTTLPNGNVIAGGIAGGSEFLLQQFTSTGGIDNSFGFSGAVINNPGLPTHSGWGSLAYQPAGNLLIAGGLYQGPSHAEFPIAVSQFNATTGAINGHFGSGGTVERVYPGLPAIFGGVASQTDGKTVVAGGAPTVGAVTELTVFRLDGPTASMAAPAPAAVSKNGPVTLNFALRIDAALPGAATPTVCGPAGSSVAHGPSCNRITIPAGVTAVTVPVTVNINTAVGTQTAVPVTVQSGGGVTASPTHATAIGYVQHFPPAPSYKGYWLVATDGGIFTFGNVGFYGSTGNVPLNKPIVTMAPTANGKGYWLAASDGGIFTFGDAHFYGSTGNVHLNKPIVGMAPTADGKGYWLVATDGGIFTFGDAHFYGSTGNVHLNEPIVAMAPTPDGKGYWLVASDGGIFTFGDARFLGSTGNVHLNRPIVGMAAYPGAPGYWLVATDGGIFTFGAAGFHGSTGNVHLNKPIVGMAATPDGKGYWLVASDGGIFTFGDAHFYGSTGNVQLHRPIVGMAG